MIHKSALQNKEETKDFPTKKQNPDVDFLLSLFVSSQNQNNHNSLKNYYF